MTRMKTRFLDCSGMSIEEAESWGEELAQLQRDIMFYVGDLARYSEAKWPGKSQQIWPEWASPGMIQRAAGVCRAFPKEEDRQFEATYSQYMQVAGKPDRAERLAAIVEKGLTSDESRKEAKEETTDGPRWLAAFDVNLFVNTHFHAGAGVETASQVVDWLRQTVSLLREKGLTDVACCFDSPRNHRKELTVDWERKYKDRPTKDPEIYHQLNLTRELLERNGFACVSVDGMEADDVLASYAKQFKGPVTLITTDKDLRQSLSGSCNILESWYWKIDDLTGERTPEFVWTTAANAHLKPGSVPVPADRWIEYQCIAGDSADKIQGAVGIGTIGAAAIINTFGSAEAAIAAAKAGDERLKPKQRDSLIAFEPQLEITRRLVTMRTDLNVTQATRIP